MTTTEIQNNLKKQSGGPSGMPKCKHCECETDMKIFVPIKNTRRQWAGDPKYGFSIKSICFNCHKFIRFIPLTDEFIEEIKNSTLMNLDTEKRY